jgi:hypothetical protein
VKRAEESFEAWLPDIKKIYPPKSVRFKAVNDVRDELSDMSDELSDMSDAEMETTNGGVVDTADSKPGDRQ